MRTTRFALPAALSTVLAAGLVGLGAPALATSGDPFDCDDFATQEEAQAELDRDPGDPSGLDADDDGVACEDLPRGGSPGAGPTGTGTGSMTMPSGGVATGLGGGAGGTTTLLAAGGALAAAGASGVVLLRRRPRG
ncbi:excalibur calcium-binding domain-containing protein [Pseudokineococcus sp. 1T1Z-3]|uniref:excalibur calcium-binding domain-containing protein n=1 Tax=Pseudokineococcus sp. 1T1Z-3 TaxID=3132745 RepID=UPI0030B75B0B